MAKRLSEAQKKARVTKAKVKDPAERIALLRKATSRVKARTTIDFVRSVRGR